MMTNKVCTRCGIEKDIEQFALRNRFTPLRQSHCIDCGGEMRDAWYMKNREEQVRAGMKRRDEYKQVLREYVWIIYLLIHV